MADAPILARWQPVFQFCLESVEPTASLRLDWRDLDRTKMIS